MKLSDKSHASASEIEMRFRQWEKNITSLKELTPRVEPHKKPEYDRLLDSMIVKLSMLIEHARRVKSGHKANRRTQSSINRNLVEMQKVYVNALSMIR